jgi:short-subunit dehydrogenase
MDRILITGASSGLGEALARHYAKPNRQLLLWGRDRERLDDVATACRRAGAEASTRSLDLMDIDAAIAAVRCEDQQAPIDLALLSAGLGDIRPRDAAVESTDLIHRLGLVNFVAPCAMASALAESMIERRYGRIVLIGSAASFHALPFAATYAGSKAGLSRFADALRVGIAEYGVRVTLVSPGFIDTATGRRVPGQRPFLMQPEVAAVRIAEAAEQGRAHLIMPWPFAAARIFDRLLPTRLRDRILLSLTP